MESGGVSFRKDGVLKTIEKHSQSRNIPSRSIVVIREHVTKIESLYVSHYIECIHLGE